MTPARPGKHGRPRKRGPNPRTGRHDRPAPRFVEVEIEAVGGRADGIARLGDEPVYIPFTVPGDRVLARIEGRRGDGLAASLIEVLEPGPDRVPAPCPHYASCGGCALQHLAPSAYAEWKRGLLATALDRQGLDSSVVAPLLAIPPGTRRRAAFAFLRRQDGVSLGFNARASHRVVDVEQCLLLEPDLLALLPRLRPMLAAVVPGGKGGDVVVTLTETGPDVLVEAEASLDLFDRERLAAWANEADLARLSWRRPGGGGAEPVIQRRPATVTLGEVPVAIPPGAFLQPSRDGERAIVGLVSEAVGATGPVLDLFAGCGTLTFPLARGAAVLAVEGDAEALKALKDAAGKAGARVTAEQRDLARRPLLPKELSRYAAAVFDPPRAGAAAQAEQLAAGGPPLVVAVSCQPSTFAHDARLLVAGGYRLERAIPVDQFPWSAHVETVAVFRR